MEKMHAWWKKLNNRYRLTVSDDETLEEVASFQLTRKSLYIGICTLIVVLVLFTGILLSVTPLRYYIPGYGNIGQKKEYIYMNMKVDSLEALVNARTRYLNSIRTVLSGKIIPLDTVLLKTPEPESSADY